MADEQKNPAAQSAVPKLRLIEAFPVEVEQSSRIYIRDPLNYATEPLLLPYATYFIVSHFSVVPILVSSFHHMPLSKTRPIEDPAVASFIQALKETIAYSDQKVCLVAEVDFAHVG